MAFLFADRPALLKDLDNDEARVIEYERVRDRWFAFTVPFSIAHGCVVTLITYASTVQGTELANCGLAAFYACYTLSALTLATVFVDREGPRRSMLIGFGAYCILAFSYALYSLSQNAVTFAIVIIASAGGGIGGGLIWVSQARHYASMCKDAAGPAPNNFASSFAFWYIGTEQARRLLWLCWVVGVIGWAACLCRTRRKGFCLLDGVRACPRMRASRKEAALRQLPEIVC